MKVTVGGTVSKLLKDTKIPKMFYAKQTFPREVITAEEIPAVVNRELGQEQFASLIQPGMEIAITAGSRGIRNVDIITKSIVDFVKSRGAKPFIVPAMGSHGGATAEGQLEILASYNITPETMGCPIKSSMEVVELGVSERGRTVYLDKNAYEADGIIVSCRLKPHNAFRGRYESGPCKMMTNDIFPQEKVGKYMNENFVCVKYDMEKGEGVELKKRYEVSAYPTFLVIDADGTMVHRFVGYRTANDLLSELDYDPSSAWGAIQTRYDSGERDKEFLLQYLNLLMGASDKRAGKVAGELFAALDDDEKVSEKYAFLFQNLSLNTVGSDIYAYFLANRPRYEKAMGEKTVYNLLVRCNTEYLRWSSFEKQDLTPGERATIQKNLDAAGMTELYPFWNVVQACRAGDFNRLIKACRQNFPKMDRHLAFSYYSMFLANMRKDGAPAQQKACDKILEELKNRPIE